MKHPTKKKQTKEDLVKPLTIKKPNKEDVVLTCGKGFHCNNHFGNLKHKRLVENNLFNHKNHPGAEKRAICRKTFNCITKSGGRLKMAISGIGVGMLEGVVMMMAPTEGVKGTKKVLCISDCKKLEMEQPHGENLNT